MRAGGDVIAIPFWTAPVETRWQVLNWPGWSRLTVLAGFFAAVNWMIFAPADTFKDIHQFLAHQDKIVHGAIFLALAMLVRWSTPAKAFRVNSAGWLRYGLPLALILYACATEVLQPLIGGGGRQFEWLDMASNVAGLCSGWLLFGVAIAGSNGRTVR